MNRQAQTSDYHFVAGLAPALSEHVFQQQVVSNRIQIIQASGRRVGFMKHYLLWENLPFLEVIIVSESERNKGIGKLAIHQWESALIAQSHCVCCVSTQVNEQAQHFWRAIGYQDCGVLMLPGRPSELFMQKQLAA